MTSQRWIDVVHDADSGIETIRAHFEGHAYDPHWHDSYLVGFTEQGIQQFHYRRQLRNSTPGQVFLLEPGEIHDGHAPAAGGFTYAMLYLQPQWLEQRLRGLHEDAPRDCLPDFSTPLMHDPQLLGRIRRAFLALHQHEARLLRDGHIDALLEQLRSHAGWRPRLAADPRLPQVALRVRDYLHDRIGHDIGLDELAQLAGVDRFRLHRAFKAAFGLPPHAYLIQLRLSRARQRLAHGQAVAEVAADLGFADQSHLGRWFRRAYGFTPAQYARRCTNRPDR